MKEQVHAPIGEGSDKSEEQGGAPKKLAKPHVPKGLDKPKVKENVIVGYRCWCGAAGKNTSACRIYPIYQEDGWSGADRYDGADRQFSQEQITRFRNGDYS